MLSAAMETENGKLGTMKWKQNNGTTSKNWSFKLNFRKSLNINQIYYIKLADKINSLQSIQTHFKNNLEEEENLVCSTN